jgi:1,4-dihydroxy-2-naphthoyl-CoA hydrolase
MSSADFSSADWDRFWGDVDGAIRITLGIEHVEGDEEHVVLTMPFKPEISQATGLFSAGALIQLADTAATWLCHLRLRASGAPEGAFAFAVQISSNLVGNADSGSATAHARLVSVGRTVMVSQTEVRDDDGRALLVQSVTHVVKGPKQ